MIFVERVNILDWKLSFATSWKKKKKADFARWAKEEEREVCETKYERKITWKQKRRIRRKRGNTFYSQCLR